MSEVAGHWFDGNSSHGAVALLQAFDGGPVRVVAQGNTLFEGRIDELTISARLGNSARYIDFPDQQRFETTDNDAVDRMLARVAPKQARLRLHRLERSLPYVLVTLMLVVLFVVGVMRYGAPVIARWGSQYVPDGVVQIVGSQTLAAMDTAYFEPSELSSEVERRLRQHFKPLLDEHSDLNLKVLFRASERIGANAFALPHGTIVFTDAMVALAENDDELLTILAHEIGHVKHRHGMRTLIQDSLLGFLFAVVAGDATGTAEIFLGLPILLTELAYSRGFELEADDFALDYVREHNIDGRHFVNLMARVEAAYRCPKDELDCEASDNDKDNWLDFFSTHPGTPERTQKFSQ